MNRYTTLVTLAILSTSACGKYPEIVRSAGDVARLPSTTTSVSARELSDSDVLALGRLKNLNFLTFSRGWAVTEARLTDIGVRHLASLSLPELDTLHVGPNRRITDAALTSLLKMTQLKHLGLTTCPGITDRGLEALAQMAHLRGLDLRGNSGITDVGLARLHRMKNLRLLLLGGCTNISQSAVLGLEKALPDCKVKKDDDRWTREIRR